MSKQPGGFTSKGTFQIAVDPEMFNMLSSALYSDPYKAIVREYSTNALDSHVAAGNKASFDVQLPTKTNPLFMIRDYGTGMPRKQIETVFQTYGRSTKRSTNISTGKFGLGCKSALAYINTFAVMSYFNGKLYKYMAQMDDNRIPRLEYGGESDTSEPNGVRIQFFIDPADSGEFTRAAQEVYPYFDIKPNFIGDNSPAIEDLHYLYEGRETDYTWKILSKSADSKIIMGSNAYPIHQKEGGRYSRSEEGIHYYVDMDLFEPTPSRESLKWPSPDIARLGKMRETVVRRVISRFTQETKGMTAWQEIHHFKCLENEFVKNCVDNYITKKYPEKIEEQGEYFSVHFSRGSTYYYGKNLTIVAMKDFPLGKIDTPERSQSRNPPLKFLRPKNFDCQDYEARQIMKDSPVSLLLYDVSGVNEAADHLPKKTLVIGTPNSNVDYEVHAADLTALLDKQGIPYKLQLLSDVLKEHPPTRKVKAQTTTRKAASTEYAGVFRYAGSGFERLESIDGFTHYVAFDDETTFNLSAFMRGRYQNTTMSASAYEVSAAALGMRTPDRVAVCYIRPRFVPKHEERLKSFKEAADKALLAKFSEHWLNFLVTVGSCGRKGRLSRDTDCVWSWLNSLTEPWSWRLLNFPFMRRIAETIAKHRFNINTARYCDSYSYRYLGYNDSKARVSDALSTAVSEFETLTNYLYNVADFQDVHSQWFDRFDEECRSLRRTYPYLFKDRDELMYGALVAHTISDLSLFPQ